MRQKIIILFLLLVLVCASASAQPAPPSADIQALLGFYRAEGSNIIIREREGRLEFLYGVTEDDYAFNQSNVYQMVKVRYDSYELVVSNPRDYSASLSLKFERDERGRGITCVVDKQRYARAFFAGEDNNAFKITPAGSIASYKSNALQSAPPAQSAALLQASLVNISQINPKIKVDMAYAGANNFLGAAIYESKNAYLQQDAVAALGRVNAKLAAYGYGLLVWDAYRPWHVTKMLYDLLPEEQKGLLEAPEQGSPHNRGLSVDLTLYELASGQQVQMISGFDELSLRAYSRFQGGSELERFRRDLLRQMMMSEGFSGVEHEWWHFDYQDFGKYKLLNTPLTQLDRG